MARFIHSQNDLVNVFHLIQYHTSMNGKLITHSSKNYFKVAHPNLQLSLKFQDLILSHKEI